MRPAAAARSMGRLSSQQPQKQQQPMKQQQQQQQPDRRSLAVEMLVQGRAQAFVDFFMLSGPSPREPQQQQQQQQQRDGPAVDTLMLLQQQLVAADAAAKAGDAAVAFEAHRELAKHYVLLGQLEHAALFWRKALQVAVAASWQEGELEASCALGLLWESLAQPGLAMACHERCLELGQALGRPDDAVTAHAQLVQVYAQQAEQCDGQGDGAAAAAFYTKCRDAALQCGDAASAGAACHHLGLLAQQQGRWADALEHQRMYVELSRQAGDKEAEGLACVAYAECQAQLGQVAGAVESLEAYLALSRSQDPRGQASACCKLGLLYRQQGKLEAAVGFFERFFELARSLGEPRLLDIARANLGIVRGALQLGGYRAMAWSDLPALLAWKCGQQRPL